MLIKTNVIAFKLKYFIWTFRFKYYYYDYLDSEKKCINLYLCNSKNNNILSFILFFFVKSIFENIFSIFVHQTIFDEQKIFKTDVESQIHHVINLSIILLYIRKLHN